LQNVARIVNPRNLAAQDRILTLHSVGVCLSPRHLDTTLAKMTRQAVEKWVVASCAFWALFAASLVQIHR
jgi:hypothetical protein